MNVFLDTSALIKLYYREADSTLVENFFTDQRVTTVFSSALAKIEFTSTMWKKVRTQNLTKEKCITALQAYSNDYSKYTFIAINDDVLLQAKNMIDKYGIQGLRTLDSIQLATAITLKEKVDLYLTFDRQLELFMNDEGLKTQLTRS